MNKRGNKKGVTNKKTRSTLAEEAKNNISVEERDTTGKVIYELANIFSQIKL